MMRALFYLLLLFTAGWVTAQETGGEFTDHPARVVTHINGLNMRSSPVIAEDNIVGRLQPGQQVHVLSREGDWQQVRSEGGLFGWSHSDYLIDLPPRQLGERRWFRIHDELSDTAESVAGELHHIGPHSYIYVTVHPEMSSSVRLEELYTFAKAFDEEIFPKTFAFWAPDPRPSHEGDERIVILLSVGYQISSGILGVYHRRDDMPGELHPYDNRTGFLEIVWERRVDPSFHNFVSAHELQHLIHHQFDTDEYSWVNEGLSVFTSGYVNFSVWDRFIIQNYQDQPYSQLNVAPEMTCGEGPGLLFNTYILEQLGLEGLRDFARRPENGLAALDEVLAKREGGHNAESFFADFVLANYLRNPQLGDGRFGYQEFVSLPVPKPYVRGNVVELPTLVHQSLPPYATDYYDFALSETDSPQSLELTLQFPQSASQDAWLQLVQVVDGEVLLQRYRASDYRDRMMPATFHPDAEQAFLAISPIGANARHLTANQPYELRIQEAKNEIAELEYNSIESSLSPKPPEPTNASEQRTPLQLTHEIDLLLDQIIENKRNIQSEYRMAEFINRVEKLIAEGAAIEGSSGDSLLIKVVKSIQSPELLTLLLENGADPNRGLNYRMNFPGIIGTFSAKPLIYAVYFGDFESIKLLLDARAIVDNSVLLLASTGGAMNSGDTRILNLLLSDGANSRITVSGLSAAAKLARQRRHHAKAEILEAAAEKLN